MAKAEEIFAKLKEAGVVAFIDRRDKSPGFKVAEHETNGIPVRIEIGPKELTFTATNMVFRLKKNKNIYQTIAYAVENPQKQW